MGYRVEKIMIMKMEDREERSVMINMIGLQGKMKHWGRRKIRG